MTISATSTAAAPVIIVGSLNADLVVRTERFPKPGETLHGSDLQILPGGKSANQAVAAAKLGASVRMVGAVGDDGNGDLLRASVAAAGVDVRAVRVLEGVATGSAVITVDGSGENTIVIAPGANGRLTPDDLADVEVPAGVLGLCLEVPLPVVISAAQRMRDAGGTVLTNLSPFGSVPQELLDRTDVLLVNEHEAEQLGAHGVDRWIVTAGAAGCTVHDGANPAVHVSAPTVAAVDTTGCGDAFMGAIAARLAAGDSLLEAARCAVRVGAFAATRVGAQPSYPTIADLDAFTA